MLLHLGITTIQPCKLVNRVPLKIVQGILFCITYTYNVYTWLHQLLDADSFTAIEAVVSEYSVFVNIRLPILHCLPGKMCLWYDYTLNVTLPRKDATENNIGRPAQCA